MIGRNVAVASRRRPFSGASRSVINPINMKDSLHLADRENPPCHSKIQNPKSKIQNQQSTINNQQSAISNQQSAISNQQSPITNIQYPSLFPTPGE
jgi:hypothetical protein